jgi:succinate-acetate transporter protein
MAQLATSSERVEPVVAATANPAPLGLSAFALTTFVLSAANAGLFTGATIVIGLAFFYGGLAQLLAGMWEFRSGNTFGATAFTSYGAFWLAFAALLQFKLIPNDTALGFFLLGWTIFTGMLLLSALRNNFALIALFLFLFLTFLFLTIGAFGGGSSFNTIGGWLGIITAIIAWYTALAGLLASAKSAFQLPTWPVS